MSEPLPTSHHGDFDGVVVGGGPAGLSAALYLARYNRTVLVLDTGTGRSTHRQTNHNYLGFVDGIAAVDLRENGRKQLAHYPHARVVQRPVERLSRERDGRFTAHADSNSWSSRVLVLATGVLDHYPDFAGWESYVGRSMFWCITCDGYENRDRDVVVVGGTDTAGCEALQLHSLTDRVRLLTNSTTDELSPTVRRRLAAAGIPVVHDRIASASGSDGQLHAITTQGGDRLELEALFSVQGATPQSQLAREVGVTLDAEGYVLVDVEQRTDVAGCYAAGDVTSLHAHQLTAAVHEGAQAAAAANYDLYPPELKEP